MIDRSSIYDLYRYSGLGFCRPSDSADLTSHCCLQSGLSVSLVSGAMKRPATRCHTFTFAVGLPDSVSRYLCSAININIPNSSFDALDTDVNEECRDVMQLFDNYDRLAVQCHQSHSSHW